MQQEIHIPYDDILGGDYDRAGEHLAVASRDGILRILNGDGAGFVETLRPPKVDGPITGHQPLAWNPDGTMIAVTLDDSVIVHTLTNNHQRVIEFESGSLEVHAVSWSRNGRELAIGRRGLLDIVDIASGKTRLSIPAHGHDLWSIDWDSKGTRIATGSFDHHVKVFRADTGEQLHDLNHPSGVTSVKFSPDDRYLACATTGQEVFVWDVETVQLLRRFVGHRDRVHGVDWKPHGTELVSSGSDRAVRRWITDFADVPAVFGLKGLDPGGIQAISRW